NQWQIPGTTANPWADPSQPLGVAMPWTGVGSPGPIGNPWMGAFQAGPPGSTSPFGYSNPLAQFLDIMAQANQTLGQGGQPNPFPPATTGLDPTVRAAARNTNSVNPSNLANLLGNLPLNYQGTQNAGGGLAPQNAIAGLTGMLQSSTGAPASSGINWQ